MDDLSSKAVLSSSDPNLDSHKMAKLAGELASATFSPDKVLQKFNLTMEQFRQYVEPNPFFKQAYDAAVIEWHAATSTLKRLKIRSAVGLEQVLPTLLARIDDRAEALPGAVQAATLVAKMAGAGEERQAQGSSERFTISINIGSKKIEQVVEPTIDLTPTPKELEKPNE